MMTTKHKRLYENNAGMTTSTIPNTVIPVAVRKMQQGEDKTGIKDMLSTVLDTKLQNAIGDKRKQVAQRLFNDK